MENVTKALLMAAGMFFTILILSALVALYNELSTYYENKHELSVIEQTEKFNKRFAAYNKDNLRGSELISFMNKVIDYNASEVYHEEKGYKRIRVTIELGGQDILNQFKYENTYTTKTNQYLLGTITNTAGEDWRNDLKLIDITNTPVVLSATLQAVGIIDITDNQLQQLASNIANIMADENDAGDTYNRLKRAELLENVLGIEVRDTSTATIRIDEETGKIKSDPNDIIDTIKEVTSQYYQYMQFKRAYFDCTDMIYDTQTNRVVEIKFKVKTKMENGKQIVIFN